MSRGFVNPDDRRILMAISEPLQPLQQVPCIYTFLSSLLVKGVLLEIQFG